MVEKWILSRDINSLFLFTFKIGSWLLVHVFIIYINPADSDKNAKQVLFNWRKKQLVPVFSLCTQLKVFRK